MSGIIYKCTCIPNGKVYIGQTVNDLRARVKKHERDSRRFDYKFYRAIRKYGWNSFEWEILVDNVLSIESLNRLEKFFIQVYNSFKRGYNSTLGGEGTVGIVVSEETRRKISKLLTGRTGKDCPNSVPVYQLDLATKEIVAEYDAISDAHRATGFDISLISKCCRGIRNSTGGYAWRYKNLKEEN